MSFAMQTYAKQQYGERTYTSLRSILDDPADALVTSASLLSRPVAEDLDILSASQYPQGLMQQPYEGNPRKRKTASSSQQLYGGIVPVDDSMSDHLLSSTTPESQPRQKKKKQQKPANKRASNASAVIPGNGNDTEQVDSKKQRGRPRLDIQDEAAADRRRTQIRLAQRAYRHRKETTISALKQKVTDLRDTVDRMNETFLTLHRHIVENGLLASDISLGQQLQAAEEEFAVLAKMSSLESDDEEAGGDVRDHPKENSRRSSKSDKTDAKQRQHASRPDRTLSSSSSQQLAEPGREMEGGQAASSHGGGGQVSSTTASAEAELGSISIPLDHISHSSSSSNNDHQDRATKNTNNAPPSPNPDPPEAEAAWYEEVNVNDQDFTDGLLDFNSINTTITNPLLPLVNVNQHDNHTVYEEQPQPPPGALEIERPLVSPSNHGSYTYSFQETTFARRLHRMVLERGFRNLSNPAVDVKAIQHSFRFSFCFANRKHMIGRFQEILRRRAGEALENFAAPFLAIGGAGTHFPRRDELGNPIYPPNCLSPLKAFGPFPYIESETPRADSSVQELLENIGFGGEWYDSHDVEEYLKTKGIFLDGHSSFVDVDPSVVMGLANFNGSGSGSSTNSIGRSDSGATTYTSGTAAAPFSSSSSTSTSSIPSPPSDVSPNVHGNDLLSTTTTSSSPSYGHENPWWTNGTNSAANIGTNTHELPSALPSPHSAAMPFGSQSQQQQESHFQTVLTFDVDQFLEHMVESGACLGRAPGFRKERVDEALAKSLSWSSSLSFGSNMNLQEIFG
ncbi:hypothetical protein KCU88_g2187, partial [Aureobasidium melanogenum]